MKSHQSLPAGNIRLLILSLVATAVVSLLPISSHATIDWNEGFEYTDDAALDVVWDMSCRGNPGISTLRPFSGSKSLRLVFKGKVGVDPGAGGCYMNRYLSAPSDTLYARWYMYMDNFTVDAGHTKISIHGQPAKAPSVWWTMYWGQSVLSATVQGIILDNGQADTVNVYANAAIPHNQWVCVETRLTMSSPGVDNGIIQAWYNGTQVLNKTNQRMRVAVQTGNKYPDTKFSFISLYVQNGRGVIYYDDYAVSRDSKIGCSGSSSTPAGDSTPPANPSGVLVR